jgi:hypothetical protein
MHSRLSILYIVYALILSCNDYSASKNTVIARHDFFEISINSPYSCYNEIHLDSDGLFTNIFGFNSGNNNKTIKKKTKLYIHSKADIAQIHELIGQIKTRGLITSSEGNDLSHFVLLIDDKKFIDKFGQDSLVNKILNVLVPYVQNEENLQCDYFNFIKRTHAWPLTRPNPDK